MDDTRYCPNCGKKISKIMEYCPYCGYHIAQHNTDQQASKRTERLHKRNSKSNMIKIITCLLIVLIIIFAIVGLSIARDHKKIDNTSHSSIQQASNNSNNSSSSSKEQTIEGTFVSWKDGAGITLNSDGTGRYVFADPVNADTDDNITWQSIDSNRIKINMHDDNVSKPVIAEFRTDNGIKKLLLTSDDPSWNSESLNKISSSMGLDEFLKNVHDQDSEGHGPNVTSR